MEHAALIGKQEGTKIEKILEACMESPPAAQYLIDLGNTAERAIRMMKKYE